MSQEEDKEKNDFIKFFPKKEMLMNLLGCISRKKSYSLSQVSTDNGLQNKKLRSLLMIPSEIRKNFPSKYNGEIFLMR
jgi:hypothetical protein